MPSITRSDTLIRTVNCGGLANGDNPYSWVDQCGKPDLLQHSCGGWRGRHPSPWMQGSYDITIYDSNAHGLIMLQTWRSIPMRTSKVLDGGREENYLGVNQATALFNVAAAYGRNILTTIRSCSLAVRRLRWICLDANGRPIHQFASERSECRSPVHGRRRNHA